MNSRLLGLTGLATVLAMTATFGISAQTPGIPGPGAGRHAGQRRERHPELMQALKALRNARARLQAAARDFGGHREKAVDHTDSAIREVEQAIEFDKH